MVLSSRSFAVTSAPGPDAPFGLLLADPGEVLVVGLGNPILGDDGVGWQVVDELARIERPPVGLQQACVGGVGLMELMIGYRRAIVVDAIIDPGAAPGSVWRRPLSAVETRVASHLDSSHDATLSAALAAGRAVGADLPSEIEVVGIVVERGDIFSQRLSNAVAAAVPVAAAEVMTALGMPPQPSAGREPAHA
jgi:hydrogenase maturation protease